MLNGGRIWLVIGGLVAVVIIALGYLVFASPMLGEAAQADTQRAGIESSNTEQEAVLQKMKQQYANIDALKQQLADLNVSIPGYASTDVYLDQLAQDANAAKVSIDNLSMTSASLYAVQTGDAPTTGLAKPTLPSSSLGQNLYQMKVTLHIEGSAAGLVGFLGLLQQQAPKNASSTTFSPGRLQLITSADLKFDKTLTGDITSYIFVVHNPADGPVGALPTPQPTASGTPAPTASGTPAPTTSGTPAPTATP